MILYVFLSFQSADDFSFDSDPVTLFGNIKKSENSGDTSPTSPLSAETSPNSRQQPFNLSEPITDQIISNQSFIGGGDGMMVRIISKRMITFQKEILMWRWNDVRNIFKKDNDVSIFFC